MIIEKVVARKTLAVTLALALFASTPMNALAQTYNAPTGAVSGVGALGAAGSFNPNSVSIMAPITMPNMALNTPSLAPSVIAEIGDDIFRRVTAGDFQGVTSSVTLTEVLVHPFDRHDYKLAKSYRHLLQNSVNFRTIVVDNVVAERAARLRADYKLRTPDALQIATALEFGCEAFLTNDAALTRVGALRVLTLDELEWTPGQ